MDSNMLSFIENAVKNGKSVEDLAKEMSDALNAVSKSKMTTRDTLIDYEANFYDILDDTDGLNEIPAETLAGYIVSWIAANGSTLKKWDVKDIESLTGGIATILDEAEEACEMIKELTEEMNAIFAPLLEMVSKHDCGKGCKECSTNANASKKPDINTDIIKDFLRTHNL